MTDHFPGLQIQWDELENNEVIEKLRDNTLDVGFIIGVCSYKEFSSISIYTGKMNAIIYPGHPYYDREVLRICRINH